jgi:hypothetical protein
MRHKILGTLIIGQAPRPVATSIIDRHLPAFVRHTLGAPVDITLLPGSAPAAYTTAARSLAAAVTASPPTGAPNPV